MTDPTRKITINGTSLIIPATGRLVKLFKVLSAATTATLEENNTDYIVPTSKKLWIIGTKAISTVYNEVHTIKKHTVVDTDAGTLIYAGNVDAANIKSESTEMISVEAGKYLNALTAYADLRLTVYGVEIDA